MNEKKSYKVQILQEHYVLISDETEDFVMKAAAMVDTTMQEISKYSAITDQKKIAVLAALRIAEAVLSFERLYHKEEQHKIALKDFIDQQLSTLHI
jgi:cell division protein ZapA (FtsZ GTPase activity inhibitor)